MQNSILADIKKAVGITEEVDAFDNELIMHINTVMVSLRQLGVGPETGFTVTDVQDTWEDLVGDRTDLASIKTYVYLKVRILFDPPNNGTIMDAYQKSADEIEWRLNLAAENKGVL